VGTRGKRWLLSPKTSARARAVWCNAINVNWKLCSGYLK
jgi:hypothetical protein